jgi:putative lipoic acid-binding regulatory protein
MADEFEKLRELLQESNYPSVYLYKFIVKKDPEKVVEIKKCFNESAEFKTQASKNGNYISVSIKEMMLNAESIIDRYKAVGKIENVIAL